MGFSTHCYKKWSIPAWAGEPAAYKEQGGTPGVYPRVGGGTEIDLGFLTGYSGLSPRGRGNHERRCSCGRC